ALECAATTDPTAGVRLMDAATAFRILPYGLSEGDAAYARALDAVGERSTILRGRALAGRGFLASWGGKKEDALDWCHAALEIGRACDDAWTQGRALDTLGALVSLDDPASGRPLLHRSIELATQAGDDWCRLDATCMLAAAWFFQDEFDTARPILDDAYAIATQIRNQGGIVVCWFWLGWEAMVQGRLKQARELFARSIAACEEISDPTTNGFVTGFLSHLHLVCGETELAYTLADTTLQRVQQTGVGSALSLAQQALGRTELALGKLAAAREHLHNAANIDRHGPLYFSSWFSSWALAGLGTLERLEGNLQAASYHGKEALEGAQRLGSGWMQADAQRLLARVALATGNTSDAERYAHDALAILRAKGLALGIPECLD